MKHFPHFLTFSIKMFCTKTLDYIKMLYKLNLSLYLPQKSEQHKSISEVC